MERDPYPLDTIPLQPRRKACTAFAWMTTGSSFRPGPGWREITVVRIGHRESVYERLERLSADD